MKRPSRRLLALLMLAGTAAAFPLYRVLTRPPVRYTVRGVAMDVGMVSVATDINNRGEVVGMVIPDRIFKDQGGHLTHRAVSDAGFVEINGRGDILYHSPDGPALWRSGRIQGLTAFGRTIKNGRLTEDGTIVGEIERKPTTTEVVRWRDGRANWLPYERGSIHLNQVTRATAAGIVVGQSDTGMRAYRAGNTFSLSPLPGYSVCQIEAVNDQGQIVGASQRPQSEPISQACLWENGTVRKLGALRVASDINEAGQVVGWQENVDNPHILWGAWRTPSRMLEFVRGPHAALYQHGESLDLNDLIPRRSGWTLEIATAINDKGQIVGTGRYKGQQRGFVLTPVTETR